MPERQASQPDPNYNFQQSTRPATARRSRSQNLHNINIDYPTGHYSRQYNTTHRNLPPSPLSLNNPPPVSRNNAEAFPVGDEAV